MAFIHSWNVTISILTGEFAVIHCLGNSFSSRYCNHFLEYSQASIFSMVLYIFLMLKFAAIQLANVLSFSIIQNTSHREPNLLSKQLYFQSSIDYNEMRDLHRETFLRIPSCLEQLLPSYNYFLVTIVFLISCFLKIPFQYSYCFGGAFSPE